MHMIQVHVYVENNPSTPISHHLVMTFFPIFFFFQIRPQKRSLVLKTRKDDIKGICFSDK